MDVGAAPVAAGASADAGEREGAVVVVMVIFI